MYLVPYSNTIGSLMYAMVCTISNIAHANKILNGFLDT